MFHKRIRKQMKKAGIACAMATVLTTTSVCTNGFSIAVHEMAKVDAKTITTEDGFVIEDGVLIDYTGDAIEIVVPETVKELGGAFEGNDNIISVTIGETVKKIGRSAFEGCSNLRTIKMKNGVEAIGARAFKNCEKLTYVNIPETVKELGRDDVDHVHGYVFQDCDNLEFVNIQGKIANIEKYMFSGCKNLTDVNIPESVVSIDKGAFYGCSSLSNINIPDNVKYIRESAFYLCDSLTNIMLPNSLESIGEKAFWGSGLVTIKLPSNLKKIADSVFAHSVKLENVEFSDNFGEIEIGGNLFYDTTWLENKKKENPLVCVDGVVIDGYDCTGAIEIPSTVKKIATYSFCNAEITSVKIPGSVKVIGDYAFSGCRSLTSVEIPEGVETIGFCTFNDSGLYEITISKSVTSIGSPVSINPLGDTYGILGTRLNRLIFIKGYVGTEAERVAKEMNIKFIALEPVQTAIPTVNPTITPTATVTPTVPVSATPTLEVTTPASQTPSTEPSPTVPASQTPSMEPSQTVPASTTPVPTTNTGSDIPGTVPNPSEVVTPTSVPENETTPTPIPTSSIEFAKNKYTIGKNEKVTVKLSKGEAVAFSSTNTEIATVNQNGVVTGKKTGTIEITAFDGNGAKVACTVVVKKAPKYVEASFSKKTVKRGKKVTIKWNFSSGAYSNKVTFTSNNKKVAKVNAKGVITAKKKGKATITIKTYNGKKTKVVIIVK